MPTYGCGCADAASRSAIASIVSASRREDEGIRDEDLAAALRNGEPPALDPGSDAALDGAIAQRRLLRVRFGHRSLRVDGPGRHQLASQVRPGGELRLVAGADLRPVLVHDLADQLGIDRAHHLGLAGAEPDLAVLLAAQSALAVAVAGEPAADAVGADARKPETRPVAAAAAAAQRLEA